jgi:ATP:ADP antiporter, AAA family
MTNREPTVDSDRSGGLLFRLLRRVVDIRPAEVAAVMWAWLYFFSVLSAYYVIRPIRDELGVAGGLENLPWLFTGTLLGMILANPPFAALVARLSPVRFIATTYRFFNLNLLVFLLLLAYTTGAANAWTGRIFYIWGAIFNLFVVSVFWGFMVDVFSNEQSRRLFGMIAAGGTIGGIAGSSITSGLATHVGRSILMLASVALLELAVFSVGRLSRLSKALREKHAGHAPEQIIGGGPLAGLTHTLKSPYLLNIALYMALFTILSTFLYFQQAAIVQHAFAGRAQRTAFFANVDLAVNVLTLVIQLFLTGRILKMLGVAVTLTLLPAVSVAGFGALGLSPTLWALVALQVLRRAGNFAVARPTREILFTVLPREDKYKAKGFIDTFVYRAGDQIGAWSYALMGLFGLGVAGVSFAAVPISAAWLLNGLWLGRRQEKLAQAARERAAAAVQF